jgi:hypothetical protein
MNEAATSSSLRKCAETFTSVLLAYLVCERHFSPDDSRMLLHEYLEEGMEAQGEEGEAKVCFRKQLREGLDKFVQLRVLQRVYFPLMQERNSVDMERAFGVRWSKFVLKEATRRARQCCLEAGFQDLFSAFNYDEEGLPLFGGSSALLRENYRNSVKARRIFLQQLEILLLETVPDWHLLDQEKVALKTYCPKTAEGQVPLTPMHNCSPEELKLFWKELREIPVPGLGGGLDELLDDFGHDVEIMARLHDALAHETSMGYYPEVLLKAADLTGLAVSICRTGTIYLDYSRHDLQTGLFWLTKQSWLDEKTQALAKEALARLSPSGEA